MCRKSDSGRGELYQLISDTSATMLLFLQNANRVKLCKATRGRFSRCFRVVRFHNLSLAMEMFEIFALPMG